MEQDQTTQTQIVEVNQIAIAEIESQIATAKRYPRNITEFKDKLMSLANLDQATAEGCYYAVPRDGRTISGPSVRFAEIALSCYGNCVAEADVVKEDEKYVYALGQCRDLENNVAIRMKVRRRITKKNGKRYSDDMIATTANAACAIALRNAIFKIVPAAYIKPAFDKVKQTAVGDAESFADRRTIVLLRLSKLGVDESRVLNAVNRSSVDEVTVNDVAMLIGLGTAVHDGETTLDEAFPCPVPEQPAGVNGLKERMKKPVEPENVTPEPEVPETPEEQSQKQPDEKVGKKAMKIVSNALEMYRKIHEGEIGEGKEIGKDEFVRAAVKCHGGIPTDELSVPKIVDAIKLDDVLVDIAT